MQVTRLYLSRSDYTGELSGSIEVQGKAGKTAINLADNRCRQVINCVADLLVEVAVENAALLKEEILEHIKPIVMIEESK